MAATGWTTRVCVPVAVAIIAAGAAACSGPAPRYLAADDRLPAPTTTPGTVAASAAAAPPAGHWLSGASGDRAASGRFGRWRHAPIQIGGTWDNGNAEQVAMSTICPGGEWARWKGPLDVAVGAIDARQGETWAAAAKGAYDERWTAGLTRTKKCWGSRDPGKLYLRFAHEMNLKSMPWHVNGGDEAHFVTAFTRYSNLRYKILPKAKLVFCPSDGTDGRLGLNLRALWPKKDRSGRPVADIYSVDTYNGYYVVHTPEEFGAKAVRSDDAGNPLGIETHRALAQELGVPFAVSEWGNNGDPKDAGKGSDTPEYVQLMNAWFREHAGNPKKPRPGQLLYEIQFNLKAQFALWPTKVQPKTAAEYRSLTWGG